MREKKLRAIIEQAGEGAKRGAQTENSTLRRFFREEIRKRLHAKGIIGALTSENKKIRKEIIDSLISEMCQKMETDERFYFKELDGMRRRREGVLNFSSKKESFRASNQRGESRKVSDKLQFRFSLRQLFQLSLAVSDFLPLGISQESFISFAIFFEFYEKGKSSMTIPRLRLYEYCEQDLQYLDKLTLDELLSLATSDKGKEKIRYAFKKKCGGGISQEFLEEIGIRPRELAELLLNFKILNKIFVSDEDIKRMLLFQEESLLFDSSGNLPFDPDRKSVTVSLCRDSDAIKCFRASRCLFYERCLRLSGLLAKKCAPLSRKVNRSPHNCLSCADCEWRKIDTFIRANGSIFDKLEISFIGNSLENSNAF